MDEATLRLIEDAAERFAAGARARGHCVSETGSDSSLSHYVEVTYWDDDGWSEGCKVRISDHAATRHADITIGLGLDPFAGCDTAEEALALLDARVAAFRAP